MDGFQRIRRRALSSARPRNQVAAMPDGAAAGRVSPGGDVGESRCGCGRVLVRRCGRQGPLRRPSGPVDGRCKDVDRILHERTNMTACV